MLMRQRSIAVNRTPFSITIQYSLCRGSSDNHLRADGYNDYERRVEATYESFSVVSRDYGRQTWP